MEFQGIYIRFCRTVLIIQRCLLQHSLVQVSDISAVSGIAKSTIADARKFVH